MVSKFLEKKIEVISKEISESSGNVLELEYYLIESAAEPEDKLFEEKQYGVEIIKRENGCSSESKLIKNIYCVREKVEKLIYKLSANTVTPITLDYVLDDIIGNE